MSDSWHSDTTVRPHVAVIIPTFDRAHILRRAVRSVLAQEEAEFELIIVDDGSTDDTREVVQSFNDERIRYVWQHNQGVSAARNAGVAATSAPFVTFLDSDDKAESGWLTFYREAHESGARFASCGMRFVLTSGKVTYAIPKDEGPAYGHLRARLLAGCIGMDRQLYGQIGGFRSGLRFSEHTDLGLRLGRLALADPFDTTWTDAPLVTTYRQEVDYDPVLRFDSAMTLLETAREDLARDPVLLAQYLSIAGVAANRMKRHRDARQLFRQAIKNDPANWRNYLRLLETWPALRSLR